MNLEILAMLKKEILNHFNFFYILVLFYLNLLINLVKSLKLNFFELMPLALH